MELRLEYIFRLILETLQGRASLETKSKAFKNPTQKKNRGGPRHKLGERLYPTRGR